VPAVPEGRDHVWHQFTMRFPGERDHVAAGLAERGVGTMIYYPVPIHRQPYLRRLMPELEGLSLPVTEQAAQEVLSIPVHPTLSPAELETIVAAVREVATPMRGSAAA
jgi:perosamine synthetase